MPDYTKAPARHRPQRIQRKIDRRFGLLRCNPAAIYILSLSQVPKLFEGIVRDDTLNDLGRRMIDIVKESRLKNDDAV